MLSDISKIKDANEPVKTILIQSYVKSLENSHGQSPTQSLLLQLLNTDLLCLVAALCCAIMALIISFYIKERPLKR